MQCSAAKRSAHLAGGVESEADGHLSSLEVSVNGLRAANDTCPLALATGRAHAHAQHVHTTEQDRGRVRMERNRKGAGRHALQARCGTRCSFDSACHGGRRQRIKWQPDQPLQGMCFTALPCSAPALLFCALLCCVLLCCVLLCCVLLCCVLLFCVLICCVPISVTACALLYSMQW